MQIYKSVRSFAYLSLHEKVKVFLVLIIVVKISVMVWLMPVRYYYDKYLSNMNSQVVNLENYRTELNIVLKILNKIPWRITCLMESLCIKEYFLTKNISIPVHIGIRRVNFLEAHAWVFDSKITNFEKLNIR